MSNLIKFLFVATVFSLVSCGASRQRPPKKSKTTSYIQIDKNVETKTIANNVYSSLRLNS